MSLFLLLLLAAPPQPPAIEETVDPIVEAARVRLGIPGMSAVVALDGEIRFSKGFGVADAENETPATAFTVYRLGSIAKPITATAVMQLVEEKRLDLDAPVQKYVPSFPQKPWTITPRELLGHLGGIRHYAPGEMESTRHYRTLLESLSIFENDPLVGEPGTHFDYSTFGYTLLGCAVETASGKTFLEELHERIFEPAHMPQTRDDDSQALVPHRARGYERPAGGTLRNSISVDTSNKIPGGGLCGTAPDVARFALALEAGGLVQPATRDLMFASQQTRSGRKTGYGLGWALDRWNGHREVFHGGGQPEVSTILYMRPEARLVVVLLADLEGVRPALLGTARDIAAALGR